MKTRVVGKTGMTVSAVGMGCMGLTHAYGPPRAHDEAVAVIRDAVEIGYTLFDTAEAYTGVDADGKPVWNEDAVGEALRPVRDDVVIASKFGVQITPDGLATDSSPATIRRSVDGSLSRLGVDQIDLYYQHRQDPGTPVEDVAEVMAELIAQGKIAAWGLSEVGEDIIRRAHAVCPVTAVQNRYSMMQREYEGLFPCLEELGITFVAFSPMANGFLTANYDPSSSFTAAGDYRSFMPQFSEEGFAANAALLDLVRATAAAKQATPAQISLAWMLGKHDWIVPIPGSRRVDRLRENAGAADLELTAEEIAAIDEALDRMTLSVYGQS